MTGWRIGYLHASEQNFAQIKKAHIPFAICAQVASQYASITALKGSQECIAKFRLSYLKSRNLLCERLNMLDSYFQYAKPEGSYLMFPKILGKQGKNSLDFCKKLLPEAKVSTTPGVAFDPTGESHIRLSFYVPENIINLALDRIEKFLNKYL